MVRHLIATLWVVRGVSNQWAGWLLGAGLLAGFAFSVARWPRDAARARALRAAGCAPPRLSSTSTPRISLLVAAWNERALIARHLESVRRLSYPNVEHVICAGGADGTYELVQELAGSDVVLLRQQPGEGQQQAAARCLDAASGDIAVLTDADCTLTDASFEQLVAPIINQGAAAASGVFQPLPEQMSRQLPVHRWAATTYRYLQAGEYITGMTGANTAIDAATLRDSKALCEPVWIGMDVHLAGRMRALGVKIRFAALSEVPMRFEENFRSYMRQRSRWLGGILMHSLQRRDWYQVGVVGVFYTVGAAFALLPALTPILGRGALALWASGVVCAIVNRWRYLAFTSLRTGVKLTPSTYAASIILVPGDLLALSCAPLDMLNRLRTKAW